MMIEGQMAVTRRAWLQGAVAAGLLPAAAFAQDRRAVEAQSTGGRLRGWSENGVCRFLGVPYAGDVSGANRWQAPPPAPSWSGVRDATSFGAPAIQPAQFGMGPAGGNIMPSPSETCLFLNIWTPAPDNKARPVMFYNHGGGFVYGSGSALIQDGANLAREHDVVVVETNHRLGLMGYMDIGAIAGDGYPANPGMLDIVAALGWVRDNIHHFGGSPDNVMIWGESGGGSKTSILYAMPSAQRLFHKASIESPGARIMAEPAAAAETARAVLWSLDIAPADWRRVLDVPASKLLAIQLQLNGPDGIGGTTSQTFMDFRPIVDGHVLPANPFDPAAPVFSRDKPLISGNCADEMVWFYRQDPSAFQLDEAGLAVRLRAAVGGQAEAALALYRKTRPAASPSQLYVAISTGQRWHSTSANIQRRKAEQGGAPVYAYMVAYPSPAPVPHTDYPQGSPHASDIYLKFDTVDLAPRRGGLLALDQRPERRQTARNMSSLWATFARTGRPAAPGVPEWPAFTESTGATMIIDANCRVVDGPDREERRFWATRTGKTA